MSEFVTVEQLLTAGQCMSRIASLPLSPVAASRLNRIARFLAEEFQFFVVARDPLIKKYGVELNGQITIDATMPGWPAYLAELTPLLVEQVSFPFSRIDVADIPSITVQEVTALGFMLTGLPENDPTEEAALKIQRARRISRQGLSVV